MEWFAEEGESVDIVGDEVIILVINVYGRHQSTQISRVGRPCLDLSRPDYRC